MLPRRRASDQRSCTRRRAAAGAGRAVCAGPRHAGVGPGEGRAPYVPVMLGSVDEVSAALERAGYLPSREIATAVFLADRLEKPILVEGPAGVGKTELARAFAQASGRTLVRL